MSELPSWITRMAIQIHEEAHKNCADGREMFNGLATLGMGTLAQAARIMPAEKRRAFLEDVLTQVMQRLKLEEQGK